MLCQDCSGASSNFAHVPSFKPLWKEHFFSYLCLNVTVKITISWKNQWLDFMKILIIFVKILMLMKFFIKKNKNVMKS